MDLGKGLCGTLGRSDRNEEMCDERAYNVSPRGFRLPLLASSGTAGTWYTDNVQANTLTQKNKTFLKRVGRNVIRMH